MIRQCAISTTNVNAVQRPDGSWTVEGVEAEQFVDTILILEKWARPFNSTFYVTLNADECLQRLIKNESDFTNLFIPLQTVSPYYHAPETVLPGRNLFITGYNTSETIEPGKDTATVFTNVELLQPEVYMWSLIFLICIFSFVATRVFIHSRNRMMSRAGKTPLTRVILRQVAGVFYHSNERFKLITLLYAVFCFYIVTTFLCIYKTSHVIADKPSYPTSYQESLDHKKSLFTYYDQFVVVSKGFRFAPPGTLKRKLWDKLEASGLHEKYLVDPENTSPTSLPALITRYALAIVVDKSIGVASSITMPLLKSLICGFSPEGQLWFLKVLSDPIERETIYGYATSKDFIGAETLKKTLRRSFEGQVTQHHYDLALEVTHIATKVSGTSKAHQWKQHLACTHEQALMPDVVVHAVPLAYFHTFFLACALIWTAAFVINFIQILSSKRSPSDIPR